MSEQHYHTEPSGRGCEKCGAGEMWDIVGPDDVAEGTSYGDKELADDICEMLDSAYKLGQEHAKAKEEK